MGASLLSGVSGLRAHQMLLDVVANNLANVNTPGFKTSRLRFADLFAQTVQTSTAPTASSGGKNPVQIGLGVKAAGIDPDFSQGSLSATGRVFDMAIQGQGFFVVNNGQQDFYTRAGSFDVDSQNTLVDLGTGFRVQDINSNDILIPYNQTRPGQATGTVDIVGNLNAAAANPAAEQLTTATPFQLARATILGTDDSATWDIQTTDQITVQVDGTTTYTVTFDGVTAGAATPAEVVAEILNDTSNAVDCEARDGFIVIKSKNTGATSSLRITDTNGTPAATLGLSTALTGKTTTRASDLRDLATTTIGYQNGDTISIDGTDLGGATVDSTFTFGKAADGTTLGALVDKISTAYANAEAVIDSSGNMTLTADTEEDASLVLALGNASGAGATSWSNHLMRVTTEGTSGATRSTSITIYDELGTPRVLNLTFRKRGDNEWRLEASCADGTMVDSLVDRITFNNDGSFNAVNGTGEGDPDITLSFPGVAGQQDILFDFGASGSSTNLTQFGGLSSATATDQDGFGSGSLTTVAVRPDGTIQGNFTNGEIVNIAQLQVATFSNPAGLTKQGDNFFLPSTNSGAPINGSGQQAGAGSVTANTLEGSNVDIALEFTRLITAQRGFQVNARVITTADAILQELANIIR